ncbi:NADH pyrophosphatase [Zhongshania aliphaticivorans]|uniref:NADH pyrophosphatase n=1 Tax=Zhongshania aliphaticivorans TaxID=1470434 RepID=A0A5S9Q2Z7_9GAMM|nr:NUDIX hydrolase [Zhongshania aliphaticivorans]CAA0111219.1 NADH pyrophosphatase [Zhongshania aliphaticivorans]CAA0118513.1 NADH pyrophosphatase [Zhongshania aliphaticivorans]
MNFCQVCGSSVVLKVPPNDSLPRHTCTSCDQVYYSNPIVVAGCIPFWRGKVLLCRRAIMPSYGNWTAPGGYVESGETIEQCAKREAWEEANIKVKLGPIISVTNVPAANQVHIFFRADMLSGDYGVASESLDVKLFHPREIPWDRIAFYSVEETLRRMVGDGWAMSTSKNIPLNFTSQRPPRRNAFELSIQATGVV